MPSKVLFVKRVSEKTKREIIEQCHDLFPQWERNTLELPIQLYCFIYVYILWMKKCCLPYQQTKDAVAIKPSATTAAPVVHPEGTQAGKAQDIGPRYLRFISKDFKEPRLLHLPIHRKVLNSLTWDVWFSLINSKLLMFQLLGKICCKMCNKFATKFVFVAEIPHIPWLLSYFFGGVPQSYLRSCPLGLRLQFLSTK